MAEGKHADGKSHRETAARLDRRAGGRRRICRQVSAPSNIACCVVEGFGCTHHPLCLTSTIFFDRCQEEGTVVNFSSIFSLSLVRCVLCFLFFLGAWHTGCSVVYACRFIRARSMEDQVFLRGDRKSLRLTPSKSMNYTTVRSFPRYIAHALSAWCSTGTFTIGGWTSISCVGRLREWMRASLG